MRDGADYRSEFEGPDKARAAGDIDAMWQIAQAYYEGKPPEEPPNEAKRTLKELKKQFPGLFE